MNQDWVLSFVKGQPSGNHTSACCCVRNNLGGLVRGKGLERGLTRLSTMLAMCGQLRVSSTSPGPLRFMAPARLESTALHKHTEKNAVFPCVERAQWAHKGGMKGRACLSGSERVCRKTNMVTCETSEGIIFKREMGLA